MCYYQAMDDKVTGYCVKCRDKAGRVMKDVQVVTMKNGRKAAKGTCTECGTGMYRILSKKDAASI